MFVLGFYKYVELENVESIASELREFCKANEMKGSILLSHEGVNASISGTREAIDGFKEKICSIKVFEDLFFKEENSSDHPFKKMKVKLRKEIVSFGQDVDLTRTGKHISAEEMKDLYDSRGNLKENVLLLDARNNYEYVVGKFKGAEHLDIRYFRNFAKEMEKFKDKKDKKVVMYCTGGIRCEKASAYLKSEGFSDVSQLNQGIIQFGKEDVQDLWEGKCFVFDKRMVSDINAEGEPISNCLTCNCSCDFQRNCKNVLCNLFYVSCVECESKLHGCCSEECKKIFQRQREERALIKVS